MARVQLIHWKESEGRARADELRALGHTVQYESDGTAALALLRREPVDVIVIDCTHRFAHGRGAALALRQRADTRSVSLVILGGEARERATLQVELPDAALADWGGVRAAIEQALANPPPPGT